MDGRKAEVAQLAGVSLAEVRPVGEAAARAILALQLDPIVIAALFSHRPPRIWSVGVQTYLDAELFGPVVPIERLDYDPERGLYVHPA
ncbi:MAG: hypothetical protein HGA45_39620 [Chloroflexales bacterium]|nr:hypothetical protein [Chloroflexales bacterium]